VGYGNRIDRHRRLLKVVEDEHHVKVSQTKLNTLQVNDFDFGEGDDCEGELRQVHETIGRREKENVGSVRDTRETELSERHVDFEPVLLSLSRRLDASGKVAKELVELCPSLSIFLLLLDLVFVSVPRSSLLSSGLIERHVRDLSVELHILWVREKWEIRG
jgi:hypothetical protein